MELNEYQEKAMSTCMPSCENTTYMLLNLVGEVGELASKIAKAVRRETGMMDGPNFYYYKHQDERSPSSEVLYEELKKELGDILWQTAGFAYVMGWTLEDVGLGNLDKLCDVCETFGVALRYWLWHLGVSPKIAFGWFRRKKK